jgi:hypothetical protein
MNKFCERCGQKLDPNSIAHFCNADRFCESCGEKLPVACFSNDGHRCPEEKIAISQRDLKRAYDLSKHLDPRLGISWSNFIAELGFEE